MKRAVLVSAVAAALMSVSLYAQGRNFSGTWTVDSEKTMAANAGMAGGGGRGGGGGGSMVRAGGDDHGGRGRRRAAARAVAAVAARWWRAQLALAAQRPAPLEQRSTIDTKSFSVTQGQTTTAYALDGSATDISNAMRKATAKASWQGDKLMIETTSEGPNGPVVTHATWYLEGESLVRENSSAGADGQAITRKTYFKKG